MRLLLDQMLDRDVAAALTGLGCDVACASDRNLATADDSEVLACAVAERRVLVTLDEHFGDWVVLPLGTHPGVIRVKATPTTTANVLAVLRPFVARYGAAELENRLVIVKSSGLRWIRTNV
jgi:predicted nuclease of predicted toxin-antitoxin system